MQIVCKTLSQKILSQKWAGGVPQGVVQALVQQKKKKKKVKLIGFHSILNVKNRTGFHGILNVKNRTVGSQRCLLGGWYCYSLRVRMEKPTFMRKKKT
jgi:hypothetical protein